MGSEVVRLERMRDPVEKIMENIFKIMLFLRTCSDEVILNTKKFYLSLSLS